MLQPLEGKASSVSAWNILDKLKVNFGFVFLLILLLFSRILGRTHQSLWFDEGFTVALATAPSFHDYWIRFGLFTTSEHLQPLYYTLIFLWGRFAGTSDASLRLLSSIFSIGSGIAAYLAAYFLSGSRRLFATFVFAGITISSFSLYYGQEARPYALLQMVSFILLASWTYSRVYKKKNTSSADLSQFTLAISCSLCFLSSVFTALLVICIALSELLILRDFGEWIRRWRISILISTALYLAYLVPAILTMPSFVAHDITGIHQSLWMNIGYSLYGIVFGTTLPPSASLLRGPDKIHVAFTFWPVFVSAFATIGALILGSMLIIYKSKTIDQNIRTILTTFSIYIFLFFGFFGGIGHLNVLPRHSSGLFAILFIAIVACASRMPVQDQSIASLIFKCGMLGYFVLNAYSLYGYYYNPSFQKDDYRGTARVINTYSEPMFVVAGDPLLLARYGAKVNDATTVEPADLSRFIRSANPTAQKVDLVFNEYRNFRWGNDTSVVKAMEPFYQCSILRQLADFQIYTCERHE